ncbi:Recombination-associated protein RdgC [compost metagenome]
MNWFNKVLAYRLTADVDLTVERLQAALSEKLARPLGSEELSTYGFSSPLPRVDGIQSQVLAHPCGGGILICAEKWLRKVPSRAVNDEVDKKAQEIEAKEDRKVYGKERKQLKELIITAMLPRLVPECKHTTALILPEQNLILVDTATPSAAEDLLSTLREVVGSLPIRPLRTKQSPAEGMTAWLKSSEAPDGFQLLDSAVLVGEKDGNKTGKAKLTNMDLASDEVQFHLSNGRKASRLALAWGGKLSFKLTDRLAVEGIKFDDVLQDDVAHTAGDGDALQYFDASMVIMSATFAQFIPALTNAFGGEDVPQAV